MKFRFLLSFLIVSIGLQAQTPKTSSEILHELTKLQNSTSVLYLAAHPDDENTRMISWLTNGVGARTAYLSLTRGDGGQNLIGTELGAKLGVLRTQELMQARHIDGGQQFFSRAVDFGYSKTSDETLQKWGKEIVLSDVVWMLRKFQPDIIITRFPPDKRAGHGHHTASAMLGIKAFDMAGDKEAFPEQLNFVDTWQPKRIYWNTSKWWGIKNMDSLVMHTDDYLEVEVGGYNALQGTSYNELASLSRTQHKSQGFGVSIGRGRQSEYLQYLAGDKAKEDLFEGISPKWERYGFPKGDKLLAEIIERFNPKLPQRSLAKLLILRKEAVAINNKTQQEYFIEKIDQIILDCLGIHAEALASEEYLVQGKEATVDVELYRRGKYKGWFTWKQVKIKGKGLDLIQSEVLDLNRSGINSKLSHKVTFKVENANSQPYWLRARYTNIFEVREVSDIGKPENDPTLEATLLLDVWGTEIEVKVPVTYKFSDRVEGEIVRPAIVVPSATLNVDRSNIMFMDDEPQEMNLYIRFFEDKEVDLKVNAKGWKIIPSNIKVKGTKGEVVNRRFQITPTEESFRTNINIQLDNKPAQDLYEIDYSHIEKRLVFENASPKLVKIRLKKEGEIVGYIPGAGDKVADAIEYMGYKVEILDEEKIRNGDLQKYQAIVAGIRAYNTEKWLPSVKDELMAYVEKGGNYIVQYNTRSRDLLSVDIGPYPFQISRERVTNEYATAEYLIEDHPVLTKPNTLDRRDFADWVQERGLYFAGTWSEEYATPLGWHDNGEPMRKGGLLVGNYGKGAFMYTGISFFRELPAGVPGAYRLLANLISYSNPAANEQ